MKTILTTIILLVTVAAAQAVTITGESPICQTADMVSKFSQAKLFTDVPALEAIIATGECTFVEPDIKATIIERGTYPKVIVYVPYKSPLVGYTSNDNIKP